MCQYFYYSFMTSIYASISIQADYCTLLKRNVICFKPQVLAFSLLEILSNL